jgi:glycerol-3-phosphate dehydrogenase
MNFTSYNRSDILSSASSSQFDLIVIGGGITGAGILLDGVSRGLNVLLLEMRDFASGTSGRSTKLIHGGLRYLKNFEFRLVADVGKERAIVYRNGPHVTKPEPMLLPILKGRSMGKWMASFGVWLYDYLAGVRKEERRKVLSAQELNRIEPMIPAEKVRGGILYYEYRTDDSRLTLEIIKKAVEMGGMVVNYCSAEEFIFENKKISGLIVKDGITGNRIELKSKYIVNAAGPWVDQLMQKDKTTVPVTLILTKGVHLVFSYEKLPVRRSLYFENTDGRMIFIIPRDGKTYIGTTDTFYTGDIAEPEAEMEDIDYLLKAAREVFPETGLKREDMESCWAGLRPLIREEGKNPSEISRKDELFESPSGLITVAGGKLTGYRKMAEKVMDRIAERMDKDFGKSLVSCRTLAIPYSGGDIPGKNLEKFIKENIKKGKKSGLPEEETKALIEIYGSNFLYLLNILEEKKEELIQSSLPPILFAKLIYAMEHEFCLKASDFFIRRTSMLYFDKQNMLKWKEQVINVMKKKLLWTDEVERENREEIERVLDKSQSN